MQAVIASIFSLEFQIAQLVFYWPDTRNTFTLACILLGENYSSEFGLEELLLKIRHENASFTARKRLETLQLLIMHIHGRRIFRLHRYNNTNQF